MSTRRRAGTRTRPCQQMRQQRHGRLGCAVDPGVGRPGPGSCRDPAYSSSLYSTLPGGGRRRCRHTLLLAPSSSLEYCAVAMPSGMGEAPPCCRRPRPLRPRVPPARSASPPGAAAAAPGCSRCSICCSAACRWTCSWRRMRAWCLAPFSLPARSQLLRGGTGRGSRGEC